MPSARPRPGPLRPRSRRRVRDGVPPGLVALVLAGLALTTAGCSTGPGSPLNRGSASPGLSSDGVPSGSPVPAEGAGGQPATNEPGGQPAAACAAVVGAQLRERSTVGATGLVTVLAGPLPCPSVGVWVARFTLDSDPTLDPAPQFGARYTGSRPLAVRIPAASGRCAAAAVFFTTDAGDTADQETSARTAAEVRAQLATWPASTTGVVPGGGILRGRTSAVLAATVVGDPAACSPGESVSSPVAANGDCWTALPDTGTSTAPATAAASDGATRFRRTTCAEPHTHEVYWAETLTTKTYLAEGKPAGLAAAVWARKRADGECARRSTDLELAHDVTRGDIYLEFLWPATLSYPPTGPDGWSKAQVVCLARWQDGKASSRHLLHR